MESDRQKVFLKLKPPCVELSSVALKFRTQQVPVKDVLLALQNVHKVLYELGEQNQLDPRLAEYAFFPLAQQVFNEAKKLSPRCLEVAAECVTILILKGYRQSLLPELGKQLLILMTMISGGGGRKDEETLTDDLKVAAFDCIAAILKTLASSSSANAGMLDDQGTKTVVDQLTYLLVDSISESPSDTVQLSAARALLELVIAINNRVFLASLLPRTVSSLTKALRSSTKSKRTQKVLVADLGVLQTIISKVLADEVSLHPQDEAETEALGSSWLTATATQIKNALLQVVKLRDDPRVDVRQSLEKMCLSVIDDCSESLPDCIPVMVETLVMLSNNSDGGHAFQMLKHLTMSRPEIADMLRESFFKWCQSLPRLMRGHDDKPKQLIFSRLTATLRLLSDSVENVTDITDSLPTTLVDAVGGALQISRPNAVELTPEDNASFSALVTNGGQDNRAFGEVVLNHQSQRESIRGLKSLIETLKNSPAEGKILEQLINNVAEASESEKLSSLWLANQLLKRKDSTELGMDDILDLSLSNFDTLSRDSLLDDLYTITFPIITSDFDAVKEDAHDWRLTALSMEALALNAERYPGDTYRPELITSLYPVLSFMASSNAILRSYALTTLDRLAKCCQYSSIAEMLINNADYLVNSVAWKLNTYNLSAEAPQILRLMVRLCGARLIPYLDDLIQSIFAALDNYHGYPEWVEMLFDTLKAMVDESVKAPQLAITEGKEQPFHGKHTLRKSTTDDILGDLRARKKRKLDFDRDASEPPSKAPHRKWTSKLDGPTFPPDAEENGKLTEDQETALPAPSKASDEQQKLSKSHELLLSIARATAPHFASPSPRVRRLLLDLISEISPILGRDENTFLPLINSIWSVIVPRLLREQTGSEDENEVAYNCCAAAETVAIICQNAGDFMSSRMEEILPQVIKMFRRTYKDVGLSKHIESNDDSVRSRNDTGEKIRGAVSLQVVESNAIAHDIAATFKAQPPQIDHTRTSSGQILNSLIILMVTVLGHVRVSLDKGDEIMQVLGLVMNQKGRENVRATMQSYNSDAVWLLDLQNHKTEVPETPKVSADLQRRGIEFMNILV